LGNKKQKFQKRGKVQECRTNYREVREFKSTRTHENSIQVEPKGLSEDRFHKKQRNGGENDYDNWWGPRSLQGRFPKKKKLEKGVRIWEGSK